MSSFGFLVGFGCSRPSIGGGAPPPVPTFALSPSNVTHAEGDSGSTAFVFTVTRTGTTAGVANVDWAITGTSGNPASAADFGGALPSGTVSFADAEATRTITVNVAGDTMVESDEEFTVTLSNPSSGTISVPTATGTIINDDSAPVPTFAIAAPAAQYEGNSGTTLFSFPVTRAVVTTGSHTVDWTVTGSGASPANSADFGGTLPSGTLTFNTGETVKNISVLVSGDTTFEPDEGFTVTLSNPSAGTIVTPTASSSILNDDAAPVPDFALSPGSISHAEGNSGTTTYAYTVTRSVVTTGAGSVDYAVTGSSGSPANAADFGGTLPSGTVSFADGETTKPLNILVSGDTTVESDEQFTVTLSNPSSGTISVPTATGTITNDDSAGGASPTASVTSLVDRGTTYTFSGATDVGQYISGDSFAVTGTISAGSPASSASASGLYSDAHAYSARTVHGWMLGSQIATQMAGATAASNRVQGFDSIDTDVDGAGYASASTIQNFDASLNKHPSITAASISGTETIIASISALVPDKQGRTNLSDISLLTIVPTVPTVNSFRPWAGDASKTPYFTLADVDLSFLASLATPSGATVPLKADLISRLGPFQTFFNNNLFSRGLNAFNQQAQYGGNIAGQIAQAMWYIQLSSTSAQDRQDVAVLLIQAGIDVWRATVAGSKWPSLYASFGGGHHWIKGLIVFAARALQGAANTSAAASLAQYADYAQKPYFAEDIEIISVTRALIETIPSSGFSPAPQQFLNYMENNVDWNSNPTDMQGAGWNFNARYRDIVAEGLMPTWAALRLMGLQSFWNHQRFSDYADRWNNWWLAQGKPTGGYMLPFNQKMIESYWPAYSAAAPAITRYAARDAHVWIEYDKLLDVSSVPATTALIVNVNGSPVTVSSVAIYGKCISAVLATPLTTGQTVTIAYTQPGTSKARTQGLYDLASFTAQSATNYTGALPAGATTKDRVYAGAVATARQISGTSQPPSETFARLIMGGRTLFHTKSANDSWVANATGGTSNLRLYLPNTTDWRMSIGTGHQARWNGSATNTPVDTEITWHLIVDFTGTTAATTYRLMQEWSGGGGRTERVQTSSTGTFSGAVTMNINTILSLGLRLMGYGATAGVPVGTITNPFDGAFREFYMDWGTGSFTLPTDFSDAKFGYAADWGANGGGLYGGTPRLYYAGSLQEWQAGLPNRGSGGARSLGPLHQDQTTEEFYLYTTI